MGFTPVQATVNTTPDATIGGLAVTTPSNTGHASSTAVAVGATTQTKSCNWSSFPAAPSGAVTVTLKVGFTRTGSLSDGGVATSNQFLVEYSTNGGGAWTTLRNDTQVTSSSSGTDSATLSTSQDLTQVQVRDKLFAGSVGGESASLTATVSGIQIEVVTQDGQLVVML